MMLSARTLISFHIIEQDLITWTYPTISREIESHLLQNMTIFCTRKQNTWCYVFPNENYAIAVLSGEYDPEKYTNLCEIFARVYAKNRNPVELVKLFLNLIMIGECSIQENGTTTCSCDFTQSYSATKLKEFIKSFGLEVVLIYIAVLLKRRTIVFSSNADLLYNELFTLGKLVPCRNPSDYLHPLVENARDLKGSSFFVAGTTAEDFRKEENLYDLFVNLTTSEIIISTESQELVAMARSQKELALFLVKLCDLPESQIVEELSKKCKTIVHSLNQFTTSTNTDSIMLSELKSKGLSPGLENFWFNLALAENKMTL